MATPFTNTVPVTFFAPTLLGLGRYVADGVKWGGALHTGVTLTYSFPSAFGAHDPLYPGNEWNSWFGLGSLERSGVVAALGAWSRFANVNFVQSADNTATVGELRFAYSNTLGSGEAAHAYFPWTDPSAGDVWFNPANFNTDGGWYPARLIRLPGDPARDRPRAGAEAYVRYSQPGPGRAGQLLLFDHELHRLAVFGAWRQLRLVLPDHADVL